ncbi:hypothetical protein V866_003190 [Kwoniella sp. B9012]
MSKTAADAFLAAMTSQPITNGGDSSGQAREGDESISGFFNETMKRKGEDWSGFRSIFKLKHNISFFTLLKTFAEDNYETLNLVFDGAKLMRSETPGMIKMKAGKAYEIEILKAQTGGMPPWVFRRMSKGGPRFDLNNDI